MFECQKAIELHHFEPCSQGLVPLHSQTASGGSPVRSFFPETWNFGSILPPRTCFSRHKGYHPRVWKLVTKMKMILKMCDVQSVKMFGFKTVLFEWGPRNRNASSNEPMVESEVCEVYVTLQYGFVCLITVYVSVGGASTNHVYCLLLCHMCPSTNTSQVISLVTENLCRKAFSESLLRRLSFWVLSWSTIPSGTQLHGNWPFLIGKSWTWLIFHIHVVVYQLVFYFNIAKTISQYNWELWGKKTGTHGHYGSKKNALDVPFEKSGFYVVDLNHSKMLV